MGKINQAADLYFNLNKTFHKSNNMEINIIVYLKLIVHITI